MQNEAMHRDIVRLFADQQTAPLSIHKIVEIGAQSIGCKPGDWFGPGSTAHLFRQALDAALSTSDHPQVRQLLNFRIYVATDGTVFKQDVLDLGCNKNGTNTTEDTSEIVEDEVAEEAVMIDDSVRQYSLSQQVSVDGETWLTEEYSAPIVHGTPPIREHSGWTPVLILVPVRLGSGDKVNRLYAPHFKCLLTTELCVGVIGGRPKHALYFIGFQDEYLLHLDPHLVQDYVDLNATEFNLTSYHCQKIRKMPLSKMDPSCCVGFLCKTQSQFQEWCEMSAAQTDYPMYSVMEGGVSDHLDERYLNQLSLPDDEDCGDSATGPSDSVSSPQDGDDFVFL